MKKLILVMVVLLSVYGCSQDGDSCEPGTVLYNGSCQATMYSSIFAMTSQVDILFVVDNSGSMVGEQLQLGESFKTFAEQLESFFGDKYHIAVVTTGMESLGCPPCDAVVTASCVSENGENGRMQDRICHNDGTIDQPDYSCTTDPACPKVVTQETKDCFYEENLEKGMVMTGINGCGYERGLASVRTALQDLSSSTNAGFLREDATLIVVVVSDEDDCGEVGDAMENQPGIGGNVCYYAAKGVDPEGETADPDGTPYRLTPVRDYYEDLMAIKGNRPGMVKFAAIVGVKDVNDLSTTTIEYSQDGSRWTVDNACTTPGCTGSFCYAAPGTRYIELAQMFGIGQHGYVDTICQADFSPTMQMLGNFSACPDQFLLKDKIAEIERTHVFVGGVEIPRFSCSAPGALIECAGPNDTSCAQGSCVATWTYVEPESPLVPGLSGGVIEFAEHCKPCEKVHEGESFSLDVLVD